MSSKPTRMQIVQNLNDFVLSFGPTLWTDQFKENIIHTIKKKYARFSFIIIINKK